MRGMGKANNQNVNFELIKAGFAEVYRGKPPRGFDSSPYLTAEAQAKSQRRWMCSHKGISKYRQETGGKNTNKKPTEAGFKQKCFLTRKNLTNRFPTVLFRLIKHRSF
jgi:Staphylococcal nuclease homologue